MNKELLNTEPTRSNEELERILRGYNNIVNITDKEWKEKLSENKYRVLRREETELPFSGEYDMHYEDGIYSCSGCGNPLFGTEAKFDSGSGWASFYAPLHPSRVGFKIDKKLFEERTEVHCGRCKGHLGHVFEDGPKPTGLRYCINSIALEFNLDNDK